MNTAATPLPKSAPTEKPIPGPFAIEVTDDEEHVYIAGPEGTVARLLDRSIAEFFVASTDLADTLRKAALSLEDMARVNNICRRPVMAQACEVISTDIRRVLAKAGLE